MYRYAFKRIKKILPKISNTELIALKSGTTSIDRDIFKGAVKFPKYKNYVTSEETDFLNLLNCGRRSFALSMGPAIN